MIISTKDLTSEQVNDIIILVNTKGGKVNASPREDEIIINLTALALSEERTLTRQIRSIQKKTST